MQTASEDAETRRGLKRSAELPIDDPRSEVRGRGKHLDDDVQIFTPIVQQTGQTADAAEAHMSMGKMELMSNAAAKKNERDRFFLLRYRSHVTKLEKATSRKPGVSHGRNLLPCPRHGPQLQQRTKALARLHAKRELHRRR